MKIAYLMQAGVPDIRANPPSGPSNHVTQVIHELKKNGHEVSLLFVREGKLWNSNDLCTFEQVNITWMDRGIFRLLERIIRRFQSLLQLPYAALFDSLRFFIAIKKLYSDYDLLYERMGWFGYGSAIASKLLGIPLIIEVNGNHIDELAIRGYKTKGIQFSLSYHLMKFVVQRASVVVATGKGHRKTFIEHWKIDPKKIVVIENGSDIVDLLEREELKSFQGILPTFKPQIVYIGGFDPWQGLPVLINAFVHLEKRDVEAQLLLIGSGVMESEIREMVHTYQLDDDVIFTGQIGTGDLAKLLAKSDIGVSPYCGWREFSGLKLFDYKSAGLAIVASGLDGEPEVIEHGKTGIIVPPCDENALSDALYLLCEDIAYRKALGRAARLDAENLHSWNNTVKNLEVIFTQLKREQAKDVRGDGKGKEPAVR